MTPWRREPLQWYHVKRFAHVIRKGDEIECLSNGLSVRASLDWAITRGGGESWAVMDDDPMATPVGVYGWTVAGSIWSYWRDLGARDVKELMRVTPGHVLECVENAPLPFLGNFVWEGNREARAWLRASHCFSVDLDHSYNISGRNFLGFKTRPLEELRELCATR